jgi:hypothetical protein
VSELATYEDAPEPLSDEERRRMKRMFSDYWEVPGEWKSALKLDLERDPPVLGKQTLGGGTLTLGPDTVTTSHIVDGTIRSEDVNPTYIDGAAATPSLRTLGTGAQQAVAGNDPRLAGAAGDKNYVHTQSALSAAWVVLHNLGKYPAVEIVDTGGSVILPDVRYDSVNQVSLFFSAATSGKAYFN